MMDSCGVGDLVRVNRTTSINRCFCVTCKRLRANVFVVHSIDVRFNSAIIVDVNDGIVLSTDYDGLVVLIKHFDLLVSRDNA